MRARNIKPGFFINCELSEVDFASRLLFIGLWCYADREGRFEWKPKQIKAAIFPYDNVNIEKLLGNLMSLHVITCNDGVGYIPNFKKHQHPHPHEPKSVLPENTNDSNVIACHDNVMACQEDLGLRIKDIRKEDTKDSIPYQPIIDVTNQILGKRFSATPKRKEFIRARWAEGFREPDFETVCRNMLALWGADEKMRQYLDPDTLYSPKFDKYLNQAPPDKPDWQVTY